MTQKEIFARNLSNLVNESGKTQKEIAEDLGVTPQTFNAWLLRKTLPRLGRIQQIADYFRVPKTALVEDKPGRPQSFVIPLLGKVAAGTPITAVENIEGYCYVEPHMVNGPQLFALTIKGDSMMPRIWDSDIVICRSQPDAESGDIVIAQIGNEEATCKKLRKHFDGIELIPLNPSYPVLYYSSDRIESLPVVILGKVIEVRGQI